MMPLPIPPVSILTRTFSVAGLGLLEVETILCSRRQWSASPLAGQPGWDVEPALPGGRFVSAVRVRASVIAKN